MRRARQGTTKVWHNPDIEVQRRISTGRGKPREAPEPERAGALPGGASPPVSAAPAPHKPSRIVSKEPTPIDAVGAERQRLLTKLLAAEGRPAITKAVREYLAHGHELPHEQDVYLQLLEHSDEERVRGAATALASLLETEAPKRKPVLDSRLRRIAEFCEEKATRDAAEALRKKLR